MLLVQVKVWKFSQPISRQNLTVWKILLADWRCWHYMCLCCLSNHCLLSIRHHIIRQSCCSTLYGCVQAWKRSTLAGFRKGNDEPEKLTIAATLKEKPRSRPLTVGALSNLRMSGRMNDTVKVNLPYTCIVPSLKQEKVRNASSESTLFTV